MSWQSHGKTVTEEMVEGFSLKLLDSMARAVHDYADGVLGPAQYLYALRLLEPMAGYVTEDLARSLYDEITYIESICSGSSDAEVSVYERDGAVVVVTVHPQSACMDVVKGVRGKVNCIRHSFAERVEPGKVTLENALKLDRNLRETGFIPQLFPMKHHGEPGS